MLVGDVAVRVTVHPAQRFVTRGSDVANSSFLGNNGLCGPPLSKGCNNMISPHLMQRHSKKIALLLFAGLGFGVGFGIAIVVTWEIPINRLLIVLKKTFV